ncbi:MAG: protein-L-isoaspartate(D-aspartate) O-methyltransferase [Lentisphaeria bacterium]
MTLIRQGKNRNYITQAIFFATLIFAVPFFANAGERADERQQMVEQQVEGRGITDEQVLDAMQKVPRHKFVPAASRSSAYNDRSLPIGHGQTISQPYIVAYMTELLQSESDHKVLEIGTGSGYHAAVISQIVKEVYTIEIIPELARQAKERLEADQMYENVTVKTGDGYNGWEEHAPFDGIVVTAAASHIPPPLVEQLKTGGRMIIPVGPVTRVQQLMLVEKEEDGTIRKHSKMPVRFVPLTRE